MATVRLKSTSRPSKRPKLNLGSDESNLNDLVNFQLPPRRQHFTGPRRSRKTTANIPWAKERFINSAYRFVLKPSVTADYTVHFVDPDIYFQWGDIAQILVPYTGTSLSGEGNSTCPICLCPPVAPRMTKCGHVYCFACAIHYLHTSEHAGWHRCPICFDSISETSLKPVKWFHGSEIESGIAGPGSTLKMRLMQRPQITTLALPQSETWPSDLISPHQAAFQFLPDIYTFAKFMIPAPQSLQDDFQQELEALQIDRSEKIGFGDSLEASFVEGAITKVRALIEEAKSLNVPSLRNAIATAKRGMENIASQRILREATTKFADFSVSDHRPEDWTEEQEQALNDIRAASSASTRLKARKNVNPPPPSTSTYYFYQAASGSLTFLHPLDIRILLSHFGTYASFPETIEVKVEARNEGSVDEDLRKRCRYLAHLPEAADVTFIEADLEQVVGRDALAPFEGALRSRRARRKERERKDDRAKARAEEKEKERMAEEHWVLRFSASRHAPSAQREEEELRAFLQGAGVDVEDRDQSPVGAQGQQNALPGAWGERSFASTLSGPAIARSRPTPDTQRGNDDGWDMDAAWKELEQARSISSGGEGGRKKKAPKLVLSLNGGGVPTPRRR
ncbi:hypothetical protein FRC18_001865 [Serendipita sp. 400]|nr:hypothetical protein FRC18_001865 [Serendipita sp. 400]